MIKLIITIALFLGLSGQSQTLVWANNFGGSYSEYAKSVVQDDSGNSYITGYYRGTADFDPSQEVYNLISTTDNANEIYVAKYNLTGGLVWAKSMGGSNNDYGNCIAIDSIGNVYLTGWFRGKADFDPSSDTLYLVSNTEEEDDVFVLKMNNAGESIWAKAIGSVNEDRGHAIAIDKEGNVYTTGYFIGKTDFDPNIGEYFQGNALMEQTFYFKTKFFGELCMGKNFWSILL